MLSDGRTSRCCWFGARAGRCAAPGPRTDTAIYGTIAVGVACGDGRFIPLAARHEGAYELFEPGGRNIWTIPVGGGTPSQLTRFDDRVIVDFDWSPDGQRLVVARRLETNDIVVMKGLRQQ